MFDLLAPLGRYLAPYLLEISTALIACALVVFGSDINRMLRHALRAHHFIIRTIIFVLVNAFGYGLIIVKATPYLSRTLSGLNSGMMFTIVLVSFILIGLWAQRNRQI
ncbi:DUF3392 domain-containing protein [uncultured Vibrio sp.]|uniref:DUF3392 domain-containing protein n=1 Tax=uncultured Vibrio sp. TaxID=114054 RepID=UPI0009138014|nr:DUF3392 domain-containing protein [uncultured Vibrio sp.]OIQ26623.1 MAG: hypothetical protein BM561_02430 [Vibrio sp. MedPE-SWchi]